MLYSHSPGGATVANTQFKGTVACIYIDLSASLFQ